MIEGSKALCSESSSPIEVWWGRRRVNPFGKGKAPGDRWERELADTWLSAKGNVLCGSKNCVRLTNLVCVEFLAYSTFCLLQFR